MKPKNLKPFTTKLHPSLIKDIKKQAKRRQLSLYMYVEDALSMYVEADKQTK